MLTNIIAGFGICQSPFKRVGRPFFYLIPKGFCAILGGRADGIGKMGGAGRAARGGKNMAEHPKKKDFPASAESGERGISPEYDRLSADGVKRYLEPEAAGLELEVLESAASTNSLLRERAAAGRTRAMAVIAAAQTAGRGKPGRSFFSPPDTGVYLSVLLYPKLAADRVPLLGTEAAAAVCEAIERVSGKQPWIKWVNDLLIGGKKVCGILTEAALTGAAGRPGFVIVGMGINVYPPREGFPDEIKETAGSVLDGARPDAKNRLAAEILNRFLRRFRALEDEAPMEGYLGHSLVIGKRIAVRLGESERFATVLDIDADCRLIVRYDGGGEAALSAGEIRILPESD